MWDLLFNNFSRYITLTEDDKQLIRTVFTHRKYRRRQYILQEGQVSRVESFVIKGLTRTYEVDEKGQEHVLVFGPEDWWVGDLYSYLSDKPSTYNIDCLEDCEVLQLTKSGQEQLFQQSPRFERFFRIIIQNAYMAAINRITSNLKKSAAERYEDFIQRYPQIEQRVPNHQIASYLGVTPQSLSRIRGKAR